MTAPEILATLRSRGIEVKATPQHKVRVLGPVSRYKDLLDDMYANRDAILSLLAPAAPEMPDPRADLLGDSHLWRRLLGMAWDLDGRQPAGLYANLACLRCLGATLERPDSHLRLRASSDYWISEDAFRAECRKFLDPYKPDLAKMLRALEGDGMTPTRNQGDQR